MQTTDYQYIAKYQKIHIADNQRVSQHLVVFRAGKWNALK